MSTGVVIQRVLNFSNSRRSDCRSVFKRFQSSSTTTSSAAKQAQKTQTKLSSQPLVLISLSLVTGFALGRLTSAVVPNEDESTRRVLPSGLPRTCCADDDSLLTDAQRSLPSKLLDIVKSADNVIDGTNNSTTAKALAFLTGARLGGGGHALAIVTPTTLSQVVECVKAAVQADCIVLPQGSNTGLTGGSVPRPNTGDTRPVVIINLAKHLTHFLPVDSGTRVICWAGAGLATLSREIPKLCSGRESHSILGSTFLNPTTAAGVAFGSGGTQLRKGPAYTDRALYLKVNSNGEVEIVNTLGIEGMEEVKKNNSSNNKNDDATAVGVVQQLDSYQKDKDTSCPRLISTAKGNETKASMTHYAKHVCKHDKQCSRYNANTEGLECNRSEGKVLILATVHDTFPAPSSKKDFWISFRDFALAQQFRREVCLTHPDDLPVSLEYMDRDAFDVIDRSGRGQGLVIQYLGVSAPSVKSMWNVKLWIERLPLPYANIVCDYLLHVFNPVFPPLLPQRIHKTSKTMDHHVSMTVGEYNNENMEHLLRRLKQFQNDHPDDVVVHECQSDKEVRALTAFRFVAASAFRTYCVGEGLQGISVDYALPKNYRDVPELGSVVVRKRMRYSHFGCNVVHEDIAFGPEVEDAEEAKLAFKHALEETTGGKLPAEHGHGTEYHAPHKTQARWKKMDPLNVFNPGVGGLSYKYKYKE